MKTIVLAYDDTPPSKQALERTAQLAKAFGSKVLVTSVAPLAPFSPQFTAAGLRSESIKEHEEELEHARAALHEQGIDAETVPVIGDPANAITRLAAQRDADLVVVGTREPGVVQRLMGQSVSQAVARKVRRDVLIVHPRH
jgi:nucleotide-binding universal stress UspA family protein